MDENKVVSFKDKCDMCIHLGSNGVCEAQEYTDGTAIVPVSNGRHTADYYACRGDGFELRRTPTWKKKLRNQVSNK